jgi:hypothetical protein
MAVVDVEVHDAADTKIFQQYFENETFAAGQTRTYQVAWPVPASAHPGTYRVQVGVFSPGWGTVHVYNSNAAQVVVAAPGPTPTPPTPTAPGSPSASVCAPRPNVAVTTRTLGGGRIEATVRAGTLPGTPANGLEQIVVGAVQNGTVQVNGTTIGTGETVPLGGAASATLVVTRQAVGQSTMAPFTVRDRCGDWPSFVGAGAGL